jgi:hypothetical protein
MTPASVPPSADDEASVSPDADRMTRRTLLRRGALGGETLLVVAAGGLGYRAYDEGVFQIGEGGAYDAWRDWNKQRGPMALVAAAILAANPHNSQPWVFQVSPERIDVFADRARNIGAVEPLHREMYVGLGAALENLMLAAPANGYPADLQLLPTPGQPIHAAKVMLASGPSSRSELYAQIPDRHTDRSAYTARAVPAAALAQMTALGAGLPDTHLYWYTSKADRSRIGALMVEAAQALTRDRQQSIDDNRGFRHDWDAIQRYKDGLTLDAQALPELTTALAKMLPATSRQYNDTFWVNHTRDPQVKTRRRLRHPRRPRPAEQRPAPHRRAAAGAHPPLDGRARTVAGSHEPDHRAHRPRAPTRATSPVRHRQPPTDSRPARARRPPRDPHPGTRLVPDPMALLAGRRAV